MSEQTQTFDVIVIGLGPGGEDVAGRLADHGLSVLGIDHRLVGGECPYWGCIPSKMMIRAADALAEARRVPALAGAVGEVVPDWSIVAKRVREQATDDWNDQVAVDRLTDKGVTFVRGTGKILGPGQVAVDGTTYAARRAIVVNTGTTPAIPPIEGLPEVAYWTNRELIEAKALPASVVLLGGGAIGCELAQVMARFGCEVTVIEAGPRLLGMEEPEAGDTLKDVFTVEGITVHVGVGAERVETDGDGVAVTLAGGAVVRAERLVVATGRRTDPTAVGLDRVGVARDAKVVPVDARCRVTADSDGDGSGDGAGADGVGVWAIGDITGKGAFTHVSMFQAGVVVRDILGQDGPVANYEALPRVTFTDPEVGAVGLTEKQAREHYDHVQVGSTLIAETARGWIHAEGNEGFIKLVADADRGVLVGATSMGPAGGEVLGALAVAVHAQVPIATLTSMMYAYPTLHRGIEDALARLE